MTHLRTLLATAILSLVGLSTAHAQIDPHLGQTVMNKTVTVKVTGTSTIRTVGLGSTFGNDGAARIDITLSYKNQANQTLSVTKVPVFCTDLLQSVGVGSTYSNYVALDAVAGVFPLNGTADRVDANRMLALEYLYGTAFGTTANYFAVVPTWTDYKLAGFQLALWEIVHDTYTISPGVHAFSLSNGIITNTQNETAANFARGFLSSMSTALHAGTSAKLDLIVLENGTYQDLLMPYDPIPVGPIPPIPEPSTYALFGAASLAGLAFVRKRLGRRA